MAADDRQPWSSHTQVPGWAVWLLAAAGPPALTAVLLQWTGSDRRNYVFLYLAVIAVVGVLRGFWPALVAAVVSFALLDYFFTVPYYTFTMSRPEDVTNLLVFIAVAAVVGSLAARRRRALLESQALGQQLREANAELVRLNKEQAEAAQAALRLARTQQQIKALQEADRVRRELLANVSHELRTPLGTILAESTASSAGRSAEGVEQRLATIAVEARRLEALVNDMLDMARIEGGALELDLEPVSAHDAIEAAVDRLHRFAPTRPVEWDRAGAEVAVLADWGRLGQIIDNLLANAERFAPPETPIKIEVSEPHDGLVSFAVVDQGPGVAPDIRGRVFERFVHGDGDQAHGTGTGLGLAIVKGLVEAHAGTVSVDEGEQGTGAVFRFALPLAPS